MPMRAMVGSGISHGADDWAAVRREVFRDPKWKKDRVSD